MKINTPSRCSLLMSAVLAAFLLSHLQAANAQYVTMSAGLPNKPSQTLTVASNQVASVVSFYLYGTGYLSVMTGGVSNILFSTTAALGLVVAGPATMQLVSQSPSGGDLCTVQLTTQNTPTVISNYVPADAIVIPASATGNVQINLESSPDLVNWTAANPGTYGPSAATNRFFRVRAAALN